MSKTQNYIEYFLIVLLVYSSGSIFFVSFYYSTAIPVVFVLSGLYWIIMTLRKNRLRVKLSFVLVVLLSSFFMMLVMTLNHAYHASSYIAIILQIIIGYFVCDRINHFDFQYKYINTMFVLSIISIIAFALMLFSPSIMLIFPKTIGNGSVDYYNAYIHVFESAKGFSYLHPFKRNAGIFWEPGAYQAFINLALFFLLSKDDFGMKKMDTFKLIIFTLTIITTYSVTGYIVMFLIFIFNIKKISSIISKHSLLAVLLLAISIIIVYISNKNSVGGSFVSDKFVSNFGSNRGFINRLYLSDISLLFSSPVAFWGISYETYEMLGYGSANSLLQTMVTVGVPFTLVLIYMYLKSAYCYRNRLLFILMLLMFFSAESLLWRPLFLCVAWYGFKNKDVIME